MMKPNAPTQQQPIPVSGNFLEIPAFRRGKAGANNPGN